MRRGFVTLFGRELGMIVRSTGPGRDVRARGQQRRQQRGARVGADRGRQHCWLVRGECPRRTERRLECRRLRSRRSESDRDLRSTFRLSVPPRPHDVYDVGKPMLHLPDDMTVQDDGQGSAVVTFQATATDVIDGNVPVTCVPASGSRFPVGMTTVNCSATDTSANTSEGSFTLHVTSTEPERLMIHVPPDITAEAEGQSGGGDVHRHRGWHLGPQPGHQLQSDVGLDVPARHDDRELRGQRSLRQSGLG